MWTKKKGYLLALIISLGLVVYTGVMLVQTKASLWQSAYFFPLLISLLLFSSALILFLQKQEEALIFQAKLQPLYFVLAVLVFAFSLSYLDTWLALFILLFALLILAKNSVRASIFLASFIFVLVYLIFKLALGLNLD